MIPQTEATSTLESVLPPLPTPDQTTPSNISFESPQNWGTPAPDTAPASPPSYEVAGAVTPVPLQNPEPDHTTPPSVLKIILISLSLILLGILLGVLAAKFFQPVVSNNMPPMPPDITMVDSEEIAPSDMPVFVPEPTATPEALLKLNWKTYSNEKYKLFHPSTWTRKTIGNGITLSKGSNIISVSTATSNFSCEHFIFQSFAKNGLVWDLQEASKSSQYQLCETTGSKSNPNTAIGTVILKGSKIDQVTLDEFKYIIEKIEILGNATENKTSFVCPETEYIDCMPTVGGSPKPECSSAAMVWYKNNCPNFKGAAL